MPHRFAERRRINREAKQKLGLKADQGDKRIFMQQCLEDMVASGDAEDRQEAVLLCEQLWEDEQDLYD